MLAIFALMDNEEDKNKISQIWEMYHGLIKSTAYNFLDNEHDAEEATAEAIIKIMKNLHKVGEVSCNKTKGYIVSIVKSVSLDMQRKKKRSKKMDNIDEIEELIPDNTDILGDIIAGENLEVMIKAIETLTETLKQPFYLNVVHGHSHEEIGKILNIKPNTSSVRVYRAKQKIIEMLVDKQNITQEVGDGNE